jgi:cytoskeletal protein CcmA (bactofilin family)
MRIEGELRGREDLVIDGSVEGKIIVAGHQLTVGENGQVNADIQDASSVVVQGKLVGNVTAEHRIEIGSTGSILGNIRAPRVALVEGARFKGSIDMDPRAATPARAPAAESAAPAGGRPAPDASLTPR